MAERVSVRGVLEVLAAAGPTGLHTGEIARSFTYGQHSQRVQWCNYVLNRMFGDGRVGRSAAMEPSPHWQHMPGYRWYIAPLGVKHLALPAERAAREQEAKAARVQRERRKQAVREYADLVLAAGCTRKRNEAMVTLSAGGVSYGQIGAAFGVSGERVRQVVQGAGTSRANMCTCRACSADRSSRVRPMQR